MRNNEAVPVRLGRRRFLVRRSLIHGRGVFARVALAKGELICEYKGQRVPSDVAIGRPPRDVAEPERTFFFDLGNGFVIDGAVEGNRARWINHSCAPNREPEMDGCRILIRACRKISAGKELSIDYALVGDGKSSGALRAHYACHCGAKQCRGTMIAARGSR